MYTILVIDDEKGILQIIQQVLNSLGHSVETATDGEEGIQKFDDGRFDMVITDMRMPGIDGNGVLAHIRRSAKQSIPVIAISGTPWLTEDSPFDLVLPKPFALQDLVNTIHSLAPAPARMMTRHGFYESNRMGA
jgi:CheY-like chemotaxis protein